MADLKLAKLPDKTPIKLAITVTPDLHQMLQCYAVLYARAYESEEAIVDLVPAMLAAFLESDRGFLKASRSMAEPKS